MEIKIIKNNIKSFIDDEWIIQILLNNNIEGKDWSIKAYSNWIKNSNFEKYQSRYKQDLSKKLEKKFIESNEKIKNYLESKKFSKEFVTNLIRLRIHATFIVAKSFLKQYKNQRKLNFNAINESGVDVSIEKTYLYLSNQFQEELLITLQDINESKHFEFEKKRIIELLNKNLKEKNCEKKLDSAYILSETLDEVIEQIDETVFGSESNYNLVIDQFFNEILLYDGIIEQLILLYEHLEYKYLEAKDLLDDFEHVRILDRYDQLEILDFMEKEDLLKNSK